MRPVYPYYPAYRKREDRSPLRWVGGKWLLAKRIVGLMPAHYCYCEVFGGAGHVLYRKPPAMSEALNDINGELINFWRVLQADSQSLLGRCELALYSRELFNEYVNMDASQIAAMSREERAWRFLYVNLASFAGKGMGEGGRPSFGYEIKNNRNKLFNLANVIQGAVRRLQRVVIENLDYRECLARYDSAETLFYLDPPYYGHEKDYGRGVFGREDFACLARLLGGIRGKFMLSINDCQETREIFRDFSVISEPGGQYSLNAKKGGHIRKGELLLANFVPARAGQGSLEAGGKA